MKKVFGFLAVLIMLLTAGCGNQEDESKICNDVICMSATSKLECHEGWPTAGTTVTPAPNSSWESITYTVTVTIVLPNGSEEVLGEKHRTFIPKVDFHHEAISILKGNKARVTLSQIMKRGASGTASAQPLVQTLKNTDTVC